jgi:hypothetical protein
MPALGQSISPVAAGAPIATAVAQPPAEDLSVVAPDDRGFDWGPDADSPALPKPARRRRGLRRGAAKAEAGAQPSIDAGPEVVFEPSLDADLSATPRRSTVGPVALVAVVLLAIVAGIAGMKVLTTDTESLQQSPAATPDVPPAIGAKDPAAGAGTGTSGTGTTPAKPGAKAKAKAKAKPTAPAAPPTAPGAAAPGTAVADPAPAEANPLADAAQDAGTSAPTAASQSQTTQVPGGDADMPVVTASDATSETNPFARPQ